ncbi:phosphopantothenoylcysteine decarboxylase isoform X2 [Rhinatrema bivittatum]|uniref:phosphopantothenoylcysteine decarboxylase isoform X2 n=1 Tax=Rhinatrema bivittatum TaxID=194408 RepID=UPI0011273CEB|nr:phosphopantothenoylcysteine decarboxylase isoform X2 [Rhinatrema bivittatum]
MALFRGVSATPLQRFSSQVTSSHREEYQPGAGGAECWMEVDSAAAREHGGVSLLEPLTMQGSSHSSTKPLKGFHVLVEVQVITTEPAKHFYNVQEIPVPLYSDSDEWQMWKQRSDPILHIELRRWADLLLVAPLDANTLAKISSGICDNLLTCVVRAWDSTRPVLFCPAMNTAMWEHPITAQQVAKLKDFGYTEIPCVKKRLVCGDEAPGTGPTSKLWKNLASQCQACDPLLSSENICYRNTMRMTNNDMKTKLKRWILRSDLKMLQLTASTDFVDATGDLTPPGFFAFVLSPVPWTRHALQSGLPKVFEKVMVKGHPGKFQLLAYREGKGRDWDSLQPVSIWIKKNFPAFIPGP